MTVQKKEDRRVRYTKKAIKDSFLELFEEKPLKKISVTEICNKADINRGTFYSHYSDPYDLKACLEEEFLDSIKAKMKEYSNDGQEAVPTALALRILKEDKELCRVFTGPNGDFEALVRIVGSQSSSYMQEMFRSVGTLAPENAACLRLMMASCITSIVKYWFDTDMELEPEFIAESIEKFFKNGLSAFIDVKAE